MAINSNPDLSWHATSLAAAAAKWKTEFPFGETIVWIFNSLEEISSEKGLTAFRLIHQYHCICCETRASEDVQREKIK